MTLNLRVKLQISNKSLVRQIAPKLPTVTAKRHTPALRWRYGQNELADIVHLNIGNGNSERKY